MTSHREDQTPHERKKKPKAQDDSEAGVDDFTREFFPDNFATDLFGDTEVDVEGAAPSGDDEGAENETEGVTSAAADAPAASTLGQRTDSNAADVLTVQAETDEGAAQSAEELLYEELGDHDTPIVVLPDLLGLDDESENQIDLLLREGGAPPAVEPATVDVAAEVESAFLEEQQQVADSDEFETDSEDATALEFELEDAVELDASVIAESEWDAVEEFSETSARTDVAPAPASAALTSGTGLSVVEEAMLDEEEQTHGAVWTRAFAIVGAGVAGLLLIVLAVGWPYYRLSIGSRAFHHYHDMLRPSGTLGLTLGIAGTASMLLTLVYLMRKSFVSRETLGTLRAWMGFHVLVGLVGPALILFHAAFVPYSALGMTSFYSMLVVVTTGLLGRYIYAYVPRSLEGRELELEVVQARLEEYRRRLLELGVNSALLKVEPPDLGAPAPNLAIAIVRIFYGDRESRREFKRLRTTVRSNRELLVQAHQILPLMKRLCKERQWLVRYGELRKLMGAWRFLHRWLAIVMFILVVFHIAIGVNFGELWIFGGRD